MKTMVNMYMPRLVAKSGPFITTLYEAKYMPMWFIKVALITTKGANHGASESHQSLNNDRNARLAIRLGVQAKNSPIVIMASSNHQINDLDEVDGVIKARVVHSRCIITRRVLSGLDSSYNCNISIINLPTDQKLNHATYFLSSRL